MEALRELDGVQVVPGHFFGSDVHVRLGFDPEVTDGAAACRLIAARLREPARAVEAYTAGRGDARGAAG